MYKLIHDILPEIGVKETRMVTVLPDSEHGLPVGDYSFGEMFCIDPACDCRRVMFTVLCTPIGEDHFANQLYDVKNSEQITEKKVCATIGWGWESRKHYENWMNSNDEALITELMGPTLDSMQEQSELAPRILEMFKDVLLKDELYVARVKHHYTMFRKAIGQKSSTTKVTRGTNITPKKKKRKKRK